MRGQKGGSLTKNGKTLTAEQILDKFTATYLDKDAVNINQSTHGILKKFIDILNTDKSYQLFDASKHLVLEDEYLNFDDIEKRVYKSVVKDGQNSARNLKLIFPKILYRIYKNNNPSNIFFLDHPYIEKKSNSNSWSLFVKKDGNYIDTGFQEEGTSYKEVLNKFLLSKSYAIGDNNYQEHVSGLKDKITILSDDIQDFNTMPKSDKLWFNLNDDSELSVFYVEKDNRNPNKFFFHPHNFIRFLPSRAYEENMKHLFYDTARKMSEIFEDCKYQYLVTGDRFYHIHVTKIPNEEDILLTCHAMYEQFSYESNNQEAKKMQENLKKFTLETPNSKLYKLSRPIVNGKTPNFNNSNNSQIKRKYRRAHNFYILLQPGKSSHPIYKISKHNQYGNPFLVSGPMQMQREYGMHQRDAFRPAIYDYSLGDLLFDINHIKGKGVMLGLAKEKCVMLCDNVVEDFNYRKKVINTLFDESLSSPLTKEDIETHMLTPETIPNINNSTRNTTKFKNYMTNNNTSSINSGVTKKIVDRILALYPGQARKDIINLIKDHSLTGVINNIYMIDDDQEIKKILAGNNTTTTQNQSMNNNSDKINLLIDIILQLHPDDYNREQLRDLFNVLPLEEVIENMPENIKNNEFISNILRQQGGKKKKTRKNRKSSKHTRKNRS